MHLEHVARRTMKPGENDHRVPYGDPLKGLRDRRCDLYPGIGRAFVALARGSLASREIRPDTADRLEGIAGVSHNVGLLVCYAIVGRPPGRPDESIRLLNEELLHCL